MIKVPVLQRQHQELLSGCKAGYGLFLNFKSQTLIMTKVDSNQITYDQDNVKRFFEDDYNSFMKTTSCVVEDITKLTGTNLEF